LDVEPTSIVSSPVDAPARLSFAQKRDLLGQAVAAVVTTALIAAPLMPPTPDGGSGLPPAALPAASYAAPVASVAVADIAGSPILRELSRTTARNKQRGTPLKAMTLVPDASQGPGLALADYVPVTTDRAREQPRKPLSRRLAGWLTGNGTHSVRPFPTVPADRP
jgi:hypothetical protein